MNSLTSLVNEDERLLEIQFDAVEPEVLSDSAAPVLSTPAVLTAAVATAGAISGIW
jgi:hypothetical protein